MRIFFPLFLLLYFAIYQSPSVSLLISLPLGEAYHALPWLWSALLTALLSAVAFGLEKKLEKRGYTAYGGYVLSAWMATVICALPWYVVGNAPAAALLRFTLLAVAAALMLFAYERFIRRHPSRRKRLIPHATLLLGLCLLMGIGAATTDTQIFERRTAKALLAGDSKAALEIGKKSLAVSPRLFAHRAFAMSQTPAGLGNRLFTRPVPPGATSAMLLLADDALQALTLPADSFYAALGGQPAKGESTTDYLKRLATAERRQSKRAKRLAADYYLCALLLDRRLSDFANELKAFYPAELIKDKDLPRHYAEALLLYSRSSTTPPAVAYRDKAVQANYRDYCALRDTTAEEPARQNLLRRSYGETYWWYHTYGR